MGVCVTPGPMALTLMPRGPHSKAATLTSMLRAAFDAQYAPMVRSTRCALTLLVATIEPGQLCVGHGAGQRSQAQPGSPGVDLHDAIPLIGTGLGQEPRMTDAGGDGDPAWNSARLDRLAARARSIASGSAMSHRTS